MKLKQRPEDFEVAESWRFDEDPRGAYYVYLMDKQKLSTFDAVDRICSSFKLPHASVSYCGLKDKQGRTTQLIAVLGHQIELQDPDLRLKYLGRTAAPLTAANTTSNRFAVTVRDLGEDDIARLTASVAEVRRLGVVNYFDSQRFGSLKHGQGFVVKDLMRGDFESALRNLVARPSALDRSDDARVKAFWGEHWGDWDAKNPYQGADRYAHVIRWLRKHPEDFRGALLRTEPRWRALQVFTYQSWLWNEGVKSYLRAVVGIARLTSIRYQAGTLLFPRELDADAARGLRDATFPLLSPDAPLTDPEIRRAALAPLGREDMTLADLAVPETPEIHFDYEERPLLVFPGRLALGEAKRDELNRGRLRVNVAFTLPPGAYATLVVKRLFHWTLQPHGTSAQPFRGKDEAAPHPAPDAALEAAAAEPAEPAPAAEPKGFRARQKARKEAKATARAGAVKPAPRKKAPAKGRR